MKERIVETSIQLFDKKGFTGTSIKEIVEELNVTKGTFYYYFKSKEELLKDIHLTYIDDLIEQQKVILEDLEKDCVAKLYSLIFMVINNIGSNRESARIFTREVRHLSGKNVEEIRAKRNLFRRQYQELIEMGIRQGEFKDTIPADMLTFGILGIINWTYYWYNPEGEVSEEELAQMFTNLILEGVKASS
ncbi:TetR/AcrR family transcriptional regulator [Mesobacillus maritimus]|uniref:TetR/AcrR family transcriptional regulator n=1 Tax=Mesobacillus maritimus TaxID=1643336 RepID=A0ABS7K3K3_9BACI|nr:TetR/AcrR family transcriptional regulator [Mesobacillus maritimus]MBY0096820.1 TetR/AcrR family transcriptional regulator [Mesobacillus maritimus]